MARRTSTIDPELRAHQEWLGYLQPVGLVVAPAAMQDAGWVVTRSGRELSERQERYREALEALGSDQDSEADDGELGFSRIATLLVDHLGWSADQIQSDPNLIEGHTRELPELGETLQPTAVVSAASGEGVQLLVRELPLLTPLDQKVSDGEHLWRASAQERFERLLRETGVEAGLLFNGCQLRLVVAPKGESSGHLTFRLADLAEVSGRLMFSGLDLLLGQSHVFLDPDGYRLADVLRKSRSFQAVVSNALADQVLAALWDLLRGFQQADELSQRQGKPLLGDLPDRDPQQLYGGLITVLMRLVFLLYAEDEALMPSDAVYEQNYKVSSIFERLQHDEAEYPDTMEQRYGAWAGLMSLCRLVFAGGGPSEGYLPARKGQLFDPEAYPWLETPWISDGVVLSVLSNLLIVNGERISYRALDVEQIGSVYEGIMGYAVRRIPGRCIGLKSKPQGAKKQLTTAVDLDALRAIPGGKRKTWLEEEAATSLPAKAAIALKEAGSDAELLDALAPRIDRDLLDGPQAAGSLVFQPTEERRRSGSHYTPRSLTRPIVEEALRPWLERCDHRPTAAQILDLKICDPAMGSGAFLVESCRYLAELLERAWNREKRPDALQPGGYAHGEEPLIYARRLIAQNCLYGVDKNPFAVNLARLSLWLVSLSKDAPFTFVDHALKCGDSLVGMERAEIEKALKGASLQRELQIAYLDQVCQQEARSFELFHADSRSDADDAQKRQTLEELEASTIYLRTVGDLLISAFFQGDDQNSRETLRKTYLEATAKNQSYPQLLDEFRDSLEFLREEAKGIRTLHWQLSFPDVFAREDCGFDVMIGNPPYLGGARIWPVLGKRYPDWLRKIHSNSSGKAVDLVAHFFRRAFNLVNSNGSIGFLTTNTACQGDTRQAGLKQIIKQGGFIFSAEKRVPWEGDAGVLVCKIFIAKRRSRTPPLLGGQPVRGINSYLIPSEEDLEPLILAQNQELCFNGVKIYGEGFSFSEREQGFTGSIKEIESILESEPESYDLVKSYIGGKEINSDPLHAPYRKVIDFTGLTLEQASKHPRLLRIVEQRVKPYRDSIGGYSVAESRRDNWWLYGTPTPALNAKKEPLEEVLAISQTSKYTCFAVVSSKLVFSHKVVVLCLPRVYLGLGLLSSSLHLSWAQFNGSTLEDRLVYSTEDCFGTFPLPKGFDWTIGKHDSRLESSAKEVEEAAKALLSSRSAYMAAKEAGMTEFYNMLHNPECDFVEIDVARRLLVELDRAVFDFYAFSPAESFSYGFAPEYLEFTGDRPVDPCQKEELVKSNQFFDNISDAVRYNRKWQACTNRSASLPWRYRWPDAVRDDVLARLLALNAERYAEEAAQGLHGKAGKKTATDPAAGGKRRGRPAKAADSTDTEQMGLAV